MGYVGSFIRGARCRADPWSLGAGHPPSFQIMAAYFPLRWRVTMVAPPGIACFSALSQMLAITW